MFPREKKKTFKYGWQLDRDSLALKYTKDNYFSQFYNDINIY